MVTIDPSQQKRSPGCLISVLWYIFIGWWASGIAVFAWLCMLTIVGIPLGVAIINRIPKIVALREPETSHALLITYREGKATIETVSPRQHNIFLRALLSSLGGSSALSG